MAVHYNIGDSVKWKWGDGWGRGKVEERFTEKVTRTLQGAEVTRNADPDEPAYSIVQENGDCVPKSHSEVQKDS